MINPITDIENKKAQTDIGVFGNRIYEGALEDGASRFQAFLVTCAFFVGCFHPKEEGGE